MKNVCVEKTVRTVSHPPSRESPQTCGPEQYYMKNEILTFEVGRKNKFYFIDVFSGAD